MKYSKFHTIAAFAQVLILPVFFFTGCNYTQNKASQTVSTYQIGQVSYAMVQEKVLAPSCVHCHSQGQGNQGGVNLETYESVLANISKINSSVFITHKMPKTGTLSEDQLSLLDVWIKSGAPQYLTPSPAPSVSPPPTPAEALAEIRSNFEAHVKPLVQRACMECHDSHAQPEGFLGLLPIARQIEWEHIHKGSAVLDFSGVFPAWSANENDPRFFFTQIKKVIEKGTMPLSDFKIFHEFDGVLLNFAEQQTVIDWIDQSSELWNLANPLPPTPSQFITSSCYGCHNSADVSGGLAFSKEGDELHAPEGSSKTGIPWINTLEPENSAIYLVLLNDPASRKGLPAMPQDGELNDAERLLILNWIKQQK